MVARQIKGGVAVLVARQIANLILHLISLLISCSIANLISSLNSCEIASLVFAADLFACQAACEACQKMEKQAARVAICKNH